MVKNKKILILFLGLILFIVLLIFFLYFKNNNSINKNVDKNNENYNNKESENLGKINQVSPYSYKENIIRAAIEQKTAESCSRLLFGEDKFDCVFRVAIANRSEELCVELKGSTREKECYDYIQLEKVKLEKNLQSCLNLDLNKETQMACLINYFSDKFDINICNNSFNNDEDYKLLCESIINHNIAIKEKDIKMCDKIELENYKVDCLIILNNQPKDSDGDGIKDSLELMYDTNPYDKDTDKDGLTDFDETMIYSTNPKNPDTDGHGYNDRDEVKNGYNPKGEGKLK